MRMWMIEPSLLCRQHLLGEHREIHTLAGTLRAGKSVDGYIQRGLVEIHSMYARHEALVEEMIRRGYNHATPLRSFPIRKAGVVNKAKSRFDLKLRCPQCRENLR